jgi:hypothetical protein
MRSPLRRFAALAVPALALALVACGGDGSTGPDPEPVEQADAVTIRNLLVPSLAYATTGLETFEVSITGPVAPFGEPGIAPAGSVGPLLSGLNDCPSFEPDPAPDADADGVPDGTTFSFDTETCDITNEAGILDRRGTVRVSDPGADFGYDLEFDGFGLIRIAAPGGDLQAARSDGRRKLRGSSAAVHLREQLDFRYEADPGAGYRITTDWGLHFTATVPGTIGGENLPAGTLVVFGEATLVFGERRLDLVIDTEEGLVHSPDCDALVGGTLRVFAPGREAEGEVRVTFNACGQEPTVEFVADPA